MTSNSAKSGCFGNRPAQILVTLCLCAVAGMVAKAQSAPDVSQSKVDETSSGSAAELQASQEVVLRRLSLVQTQLTSWKFTIMNLKGLDEQVKNATGPTKADFDKLADLLKSKDFAGAKSELSRIIQPYQSLTGRISFSNYGINQPLDTDVSVTVSEWDQKLSQTLAPVSRDLGPYFSLTFGQAILRPDNVNVEEMRRQFAPEIFEKYKNDVQSLLDSDLQLATQTRDNLAQEQTRLQNQADDNARKLAKGKLEINQLAIELGLPLFCGTVLLMLSIPIVIQSFSKAAGSAEQVRAIFSSGILVEIITVLLLTMSILILGLANRIEGPVLGTLLGGISGYVLNRFRGKNQGPSDQEQADAGVPTAPKGTTKNISPSELKSEMPPTEKVERADPENELQFGEREH